MIADSELDNGVLQLRQEFRNRVVNELSQLLKQYPNLTIDGEDWRELERLPDWCIAEQSVVARITRITGALFLGPAFRQCINGTLLREMQDLLGNREFDAVMQSILPLTQASLIIETDSLSTMVERSGATVLLSTIGCDALRQLFATRFKQSVGELPQTLALHLYRAAELIRVPETRQSDTTEESAVAEMS